MTQLGMTTQKLTRLQEDVLHVVKEHGPVTVRDVGYHWLVDEATARRTLSQLEAKGLIGRDYTSKDYAPSRFGYV